MSTGIKGEIGTTYWFCHDGLTVAISDSIHSVDSRVMKRGQSLLVTERIRRACTDTQGNVMWDLTPSEQEQRYGRVMFLPGEPPSELRPEPGSVEHEKARESAYSALKLISDPDEQHRAAVEVRKLYGVPSAARSQTLRTYGP